MTPTAWFAAYLATVVLVTLVHQPAWLGAGLVVALAASGSDRWRLLRRTLLAVLVFNLTVSLGYAAIGLWRGDFAAEYLLRVNLRVLLLVYLGFWLVSRVNLLKALAFSPGLCFAATLAAGQAGSVQRVVQNFRMAFASRNPVRPALADRLRHSTAQGEYLVDKALHNATEAAQAMRSRGAFDV